jgi:maltose alpha-D-glucosyltransferase/alpha-amylase
MKEWYKDAILYELRIRSFYDSNGDGIGDIKGLTQKLDYLQDLGVTTLWLLPFYPSPKKDDGYDISNYCDVDPEIGTLGDFKAFLKEAHTRDLRVVTELVLNHTSDQHPWFQRARHAKAGSPKRDFYVWNDTPEKYPDVRIIFNDTEKSNWTYDPVAKAYYWHRFFSHQPDLNFDNPEVQKSLLHALDFWFSLGVDGLRLDAVPYLYERDGTNCENLPETFSFLEKLRAHVDKNFPDRLLLAEANQWPDETAKYLAEGNKCQMAFHFPIMPRLYMALAREDRFPIIDILSQTPPLHPSCQWGIFLRNHDELTLEMVTEEERDEMWGFYAKDPHARINMGIRRRLAPLMENNRRKIELLNMLLFSLPGTPILYYGDEIGMGDNIKLSDRNGVRTPMQWNADKNAGFSRAAPSRIYLPVIDDAEYHYTKINVAAEQNNPSSLLSWTKRVIALRKKYKVFGRGSCTFLTPQNDKILAFIRDDGNERILVVANLSRNTQHVALDLSSWKGLVPIELFGKTEFPTLTQTPFILTPGPYAVTWFSLEKPDKPRCPADPMVIPEIKWKKGEPAFEQTLPDFLKKSRWFSGKGRVIERVHISERLVPPKLKQSHGHREKTVLLIVEVTYAEGPSGGNVPCEGTVSCERYFVPLTLVQGQWVDAFQSPEFCKSLLNKIVPLSAGEKLTPKLLETEQSNTSVIFGNRFILKVYRKFVAGEKIEQEIGLHLTQKVQFQNTPKVVGTLNLRRGKEIVPMGILHAFIPETKNGWDFTCEALTHCFECAQKNHSPAILGFLSVATLLGQRTAELHLALSADLKNKDFSPEPYGTLYQQSLYQSLRNQLRLTFRQLRHGLTSLPTNVFKLATEVLLHEQTILDIFSELRTRPLRSHKIRIHGDYHLGQVLYTGKDFMIIDFEGEPARTLSDRVRKRSALYDVAGMLRSFHYSAASTLIKQGDDKKKLLSKWAEVWYRAVSQAFLNAYINTAGKTVFLPADPHERGFLLTISLIEKVLYEIRYEQNNRPSWLRIPLAGLIDILTEERRL